MIEISLNDKWVLKSQPRCLVLSKKRIVKSGDKKGEVCYIDDSYYSDLKSALSRIPERMVMVSDDTIDNFDELLSELQKYQKMVSDFAQKYL